MYSSKYSGSGKQWRLSNKANDTNWVWKSIEQRQEKVTTLLHMHLKSLQLSLTEDLIERDLASNLSHTI